MQISFLRNRHLHNLTRLQDPILDYLTRWSGLREGDLTRGVSSFTLVSLKSVYLKLRFLLDEGCVFIGHGLKKDFRIINFLVPPGQVIDTVNLYRLPGARYLSLRYLTEALLGRGIQGRTHDSVEDADAARQLWTLFERIRARGRGQQILEELYSYGRSHGWTVSPSDPFVSSSL